MLIEVSINGASEHANTSTIFIESPLLTFIYITADASCFWIARNPSYGFETVKYNVRTLQGRDVYQEFPTIEGNCQHKVTITLPENMDNRVGAYVYVYSKLLLLHTDGITYKNLCNNNKF